MLHILAIFAHFLSRFMGSKREIPFVWENSPPGPLVCRVEGEIVATSLMWNAKNEANVQEKSS